MSTPEDPDYVPVNCANCGHTLATGDAFCPGCGQKRYRGVPTLGRLLGEFVETVFNLDNRLFRTLRHLVFPGRLTNDFLRGKQRSFFHPLRLFFVSGVLMIATFTLVATDAIGDSLDLEVEHKRGAAYADSFRLQLEREIVAIQGIYPEEIVEIATDSLLARVGTGTSDSSMIGYLHYGGGLDFTPREIVFSQQDYLLLTPRQIAEKYGVTGTVNQYQVAQMIRVNRLDVEGVSAMMGQLTWGLLLLVPLTALLLKLIYIRRRRKYVEHLIFSLDVHSFIFLFLFIGALGLYFLESAKLLLVAAVVVPVYFVLALKRVYRQRWIKTLLKAFFLFWGYLFLLTLVISVTAVIAVMLY